VETAWAGSAQGLAAAVARGRIRARGGATLPEWRRRGIYRATVVYRANLAAGGGFRYLETDASDDSRPILERLARTRRRRRAGHALAAGGVLVVSALATRTPRPVGRAALEPLKQCYARNGRMCLTRRQSPRHDLTSV
jgi:hypothetical protein